jgi:hypothetical protein
MRRPLTREAGRRTEGLGRIGVDGRDEEDVFEGFLDCVVDVDGSAPVGATVDGGPGQLDQRIVELRAECPDLGDKAVR